MTEGKSFVFSVFLVSFSYVFFIPGKFFLNSKDSPVSMYELRIRKLNFCELLFIII